ncbi:MAG: cobalamin-dependent protein [Rubrivivax sp.]|nr:cobalamin-dependent protein [Rubrivivax sp.]
MVQGRISFSRDLGTARGFEPWQDLSGVGLDLRLPLARGRSDASAAGAEAPGVTDEWVRHTIERKRARLLQVSALQRERIEEFVEMLFDEDSDRCRDMLGEALAEHGDPQKVVELLLEPAARVVGDNWCADECDFLKVTLAVSRMQRLFRRMASQTPVTVMPDLSRCALLAPSPGEQHTFGLCIVDDAFRRAGWDVDCCVCDEEAEMYRLVAANHYQVVGISISAERLLPELSELSQKLRSRSRNKSIVLIAGGGMVMQNPQGAIDAGFDLLGVDAVSAVALADMVVASLAAQADFRRAAE